jgi:WD40 repeat protein
MGVNTEPERRCLKHMKIDPTKTHQSLEYKHDRPLVACRFDPLGRYVFFGAEDNLVHRFELRAKTATSLAAHDSWVRALGCSPSGDVLYSGGYDGRLVWWPAVDDKPQPIRVVDAHQGWLRALAVSPGGERVATCGNDNLVKLWDAADGKLFAQLAGHASHVYHVMFHPSGESLVSCDLKGNLKEWDVAGGSLKRDLPPAAALYKYDTGFRADIGGARSLAFRTDAAELAVGGITNVTNAFAGIGNIAIVLLDMAEGKIALQLEAKEKINGAAWGVAHHPDGFWIGLAGGGGGGWLYFWKGDTANEFFKLKLANDGRDLALSPDKTQVAVAHADKTLRLYSLHDKSA